MRVFTLRDVDPVAVSLDHDADLTVMDDVHQITSLHCRAVLNDLERCRDGGEGKRDPEHNYLLLGS